MQASCVFLLSSILYILIVNGVNAIVVDAIVVMWCGVEGLKHCQFFSQKRFRSVPSLVGCASSLDPLLLKGGAQGYRKWVELRLLLLGSCAKVVQVVQGLQKMVELRLLLLLVLRLQS